MDSETNFFCGLLELQYGKDAEDKLKQISKNIPWAKGWPEDNKSFWNAEAFMWKHKVNKNIRDLIKRELNKKLSFLDDKNLDIGCGAYSYLPSVGFDFSEKMLLFNENCKEKLVGNLEEPLPFNNNSFNSITAVFVLNYVNNLSQLLAEIKRVLKDEGTFMVVLYSKKINEWQRQKEVNDLIKDEWVALFNKTGFSVKSEMKDNLWFFRCKTA